MVECPGLPQLILLRDGKHERGHVAFILNLVPETRTNVKSYLPLAAGAGAVCIVG